MLADLPAQFEGQGLDGGRRGLDHPAGGLPAPGEADLAHLGVPDQGLAGLGPPGHHVQHARGQARLEGQLGEPVGPERGDLGRLGHHGVAGGQGRPGLLAHAHHGAVPGGHHPDYPVRLVAHVVESAVHVGRDDVTFDLVDPSGVVADPRRRVAAGLHERHRAAVLERAEHRRLLGRGLEQVGQPVQDGCPLVGGHGSPGRTGLLGRPDGVVHLLRPGQGHLGLEPAGGRIVVGVRAAGGLGDVVTPDQQAPTGHGVDETLRPCSHAHPPAIS